MRTQPVHRKCKGDRETLGYPKIQNLLRFDGPKRGQIVQARTDQPVQNAQINIRLGRHATSVPVFTWQRENVGFAMNRTRLTLAGVRRVGIEFMGG